MMSIFSFVIIDLFFCIDQRLIKRILKKKLSLQRRRGKYMISMVKKVLVRAAGQEADMKTSDITASTSHLHSEIQKKFSENFLMVQISLICLVSVKTSLVCSIFDLMQFGTN